MGTFSKSAVVAGLLLIMWTARGSAEWPPQDDPPTYEQYGTEDPHWVMDEASECWAYNAHAGNNDSITWSGDCRDGKVSGPGTLTYFDRGRMFERVTGEFSEGILQDGHVLIAWNDGSKYDGEEQNGQFNGYGTLVASDGTRFQGLWKDDKFQGGRGDSSAQHAKTTTPNDPPPAAAGQRVSQAGASTEKAASDSKSQKVYPARWTLLEKTLGNKLVAADGSRFQLERTENGSLRQTIVHPEGASLSLVLVPLSERLGTVQDSNGKVVATFRLQGRALTVAFDDGRTETIVPHVREGLKTVLQRPRSASLTTDWYPEGHVFSRAERDLTTTQQSANRLAIVLASANAEKDPPADLPANNTSDEHAAANSRHSYMSRATKNLLQPMAKPAEFASEPRQHRMQRALGRHHIEEDRATGTSSLSQARAAQQLTASGERTSARATALLQKHPDLGLRWHPEKNRERVASLIQVPASELLQVRPMRLPSIAVHQNHRLASTKPKSEVTPLPKDLASVPPQRTEPPSAASSQASQPHMALLSKSKEAERPYPPARALPPPAAQARRTSPNPTNAQQHLALASKPEEKHDVALPPALPLPAPPLPATTIHAQMPRIQAPQMAAIVAPQHSALVPKRPAEEHHDATVASATPPAVAARPQTPAVPSPQASLAAQPHVALAQVPPREPAPTSPAATAPTQPAATQLPLAPSNVMATPQLAQGFKRPSDEKRDLLAAAEAPSLPAPIVQTPVNESPAAPLIHSLGPPVVPKRSASSCLTVESDGMHWGFRNHCPADIQFSYCLLNSADRLTACSTGSVSGSVAGNGFSALVADSSIKNPAASRAFRWVGCVGGAGEVSPRLDRIDPPMGRCLHSGDVPAGIERADVNLHRR